MQALTKESVTKALSDTHSLSDRQLLFVTAVLSGKGKGEAARLAGYNDSTNGVAAWQSKKVQAAVAVLIDRFLVGEAATLAVGVLYEIAGDKRVASGVRVTAANSLLDRAGFTAKRHEKLGDIAQDIADMSAAQIRARIAALDTELDQRMVDVTPSSEPMTEQELDTYS